jgi:hypothetical protein
MSKLFLFNISLTLLGTKNEETTTKLQKKQDEQAGLSKYYNLIELNS